MICVMCCLLNKKKTIYELIEDSVKKIRKLDNFLNDSKFPKVICQNEMQNFCTKVAPLKIENIH